MDAGEFSMAWLDRLDQQIKQIDPGLTGQTGPIRERAKVASWLARERANVADLTPELDAVIVNPHLVPGVMILRVVRDEARRMREAWEEAKADAFAERLKRTTETMTIRLARDKRGGNIRLLSTSEDLDWSPTFDSGFRFTKGSFDEQTATAPGGSITSTGGHFNQLILKWDWEALQDRLVGDGWFGPDVPYIEHDDAVGRRLQEINEDPANWQIEVWQFAR
jgi:hypothetical protein